MPGWHNGMELRVKRGQAKKEQTKNNTQTSRLLDRNGPVGRFNEINEGIVHCNLFQSGAGQCNSVKYSAVQCSAIQCSAVQCSAVQCSAMQYSAVQCNAMQCSAVQCSAALTYYSRTKFHLAMHMSACLLHSEKSNKWTVSRKTITSKITHGWMTLTPCWNVWFY